MNSGSSNTILVIGPSWLGDMVMAQSLFRHLLLIHDDKIQIDVLAPSWSFSLLERMPEVNQAIELNLQHGELNLKKRYILGKKLRKKNYSKAIILPNSWKSALIPFIAKIPQRTGWVGECRFGLINDIRFLKKSNYIKMASRYVALAYNRDHQLPEKLLFPRLSVNLNAVASLMERFYIKQKLNPKLPIIALGIDAAFGVAKCWPKEYFIELAYLASKEFNVWIFGTQKNLTIKEIPNIINFSGKTSLLETIDLLSLTELIVCNDSGLMHIAAGLEKKIVAIYGPTSVEFTPPLTSPDKLKIINKGLPCSPCFARSCPLKHHACMRNITVKEVFNAAKNL